VRVPPRILSVAVVLLIAASCRAQDVVPGGGGKDDWPAFPPPLDELPPAPAEPSVRRGEFGRIHYEDLTYLGAFKCPDRKTWAFAKGLIAWIPTRGRLLGVGKAFEELEIPRPVISEGENPADLYEARSVTRMFDPMKPLRRQLGKAGSLGGVTWFEGRFWIATWEFYNAAARDNLGIVSLDENYEDPRGAWRVGPRGVDHPIKNVFHANKTHDYVMVIPESWSEVYTPGHRLASGRHREAGSNGGGRGPALYAFEANADAPHRSDLNGIPLLYFPENRRDAWPEYRKADRYHCIWIWRGDRQTLLVGAMKGLGPDDYGPGPPCTPDKGFHAHPYEPRMYFIDVNDLGEVALGNKIPWTVRAYEEVVPAEMWTHGEGRDPDCKRDWMADFAWDEQRGLLYASEPRAYDVGRGSNRMIVHVWRVN
jgi:hypothetical protein